MTLPAHLGVLHPVEQLLVLLLAFGPFVVLGVVVVLQRRRAEDPEASETPGGQDTPGPAEGTARAGDGTVG